MSAQPRATAFQPLRASGGAAKSQANLPDKCPKCGARVMSTDVGFVRFACMSYASTTEPVRESDTCLAFQRTQLAARVADAERERDQALAVLGAYKMDNDALAARVKGWKAERDQLAARVKKLEDAGSLALGYAAKGDMESADEVWNKAMGTKP